MNTDTWTYGAEHELADWDRKVEMLEGFGVDTDDYTIVNSNGIAADPAGKLYRFGGEFNTPPTLGIVGQLVALREIKLRWPEVKVNYRSNLHCHIRVPGLRDDLAALKKLQRYNQKWLRTALDLVEPIPEPTVREYPNPEEYEGARRRYRRRKVSHHTCLTDARYERQQTARTVEDFHRLEVPATKADGKPMWHAQPRCAVNVRQLLETDTIEFRHFPGTLEAYELRACMLWCRDYLDNALGDQLPLMQMWDQRGYLPTMFPTFPPYVHWMEVRYRATVLDGSLPRETVAANIKAIEEGRFHA